MAFADLPIPSARGWAAHATSTMEGRKEAECLADHLITPLVHEIWELLEQ